MQIVAALALVLTLGFSGQMPQRKARPAPAGIRLLPGYVHNPQLGIDSAVGEFVGPTGLHIRYDIGRMAGVRVRPEYAKEFAWQREQQLGGQTVRCALGKDGRFTVSYVETSANFYADVRSSEDVTDVLLIVLTYQASLDPMHGS